MLNRKQQNQTKTVTLQSVMKQTCLFLLEQTALTLPVAVVLLRMYHHSSLLCRQQESQDVIHYLLF